MKKILKEYQSFQSVKELDAERQRIYYRSKDKMKGAKLAVWNMLSRYAVSAPGVAWLKINTIATETGVSRSSVERAIRFFKSNGLITVYETTRRVRGGDGANIYVFQPLHDGAESENMTGRHSAKKPCASKDKKLKSKSQTYLSLNLNNINNINTYSGAKASEHAPSTPYQLFKTLVIRYIPDSKLANKMYGVWLAQTRFIKEPFNLSDKDLLSTGLQAIIATFQATKRKKIRNIVGYFSGTLGRSLERLYCES